MNLSLSILSPSPRRIKRRKTAEHQGKGVNLCPEHFKIIKSEQAPWIPSISISHSQSLKTDRWVWLAELCLSLAGYLTYIFLLAGGKKSEGTGRVSQENSMPGVYILPLASCKTTQDASVSHPLQFRSYPSRWARRTPSPRAPPCRVPCDHSCESWHTDCQGEAWLVCKYLEPLWGMASPGTQGSLKSRSLPLLVALRFSDLLGLSKKAGQWSPWCFTGSSQLWFHSPRRNGIIWKKKWHPNPPSSKHLKGPDRQSLCSKFITTTERGSY